MSIKPTQCADPELLCVLMRPGRNIQSQVISPAKLIVDPLGSPVSSLHAIQREDRILIRIGNHEGPRRDHLRDPWIIPSKLIHKVHAIAVAGNAVVNDMVS